jgi:hypothetical protein
LLCSGGFDRLSGKVDRFPAGIDRFYSEIDRFPVERVPLFEVFGAINCGGSI